MTRIFLLSPAQTSGPRAQLLVSPNAAFDLARRLRGSHGAPLGEVFSFLSSLYFRGKLAYALRFATHADARLAVLVITPGFGLRPPEDPVDLSQLHAFAAVPIDASEPRYLEPLLRDARSLVDRTPEPVEFVLLGSVASAKYVGPLSAVFGDRLVFPSDFVGRGDMSRGGLLLRSVDSSTELAYVPVRGAILRGPRPPRLPPRKRAR
jgi:hypothetical protein